ncbi:hypothetical protein PIB30_012384 [Stylosanthes scabra]|uniref:Secreted protein n=1 Tax=Stylosanthes scabra TaxID=79078 RepID=A0ABU6Q6U4_9FABA|nr:hypothetical protein [Stylosanthes scabra]
MVILHRCWCLAAALTPETGCVVAAASWSKEPSAPLPLQGRSPPCSSPSHPSQDVSSPSIEARKRRCLCWVVLLPVRADSSFGEAFLRQLPLLLCELKLLTDPTRPPPFSSVAETSAAAAHWTATLPKD